MSAETIGAHDGPDYSEHPANGWARFRSAIGITCNIPGASMLTSCRSENIREPAAEMFGTMILTLVASNGQAVLGSNTGVASSSKGDWLSPSFGWACSSSTLVSSRASDLEHGYGCFSGCMDRQQCLWRPREPCGKSPSRDYPVHILKHNHAGDSVFGCV